MAGCCPADSAGKTAILFAAPRVSTRQVKMPVEGQPTSSRLFADSDNRIPVGLAPFGVGDWDQALGNHRAVVRVAVEADAVCAYLPWRRRDAHPETKHVCVMDARTGQEVANAVVLTCNREYGEVAFQPASGPGLYHLYYLQPIGDENACKWPRWAFPIHRYRPPMATASAEWLARHHLQPADLKSLPLSKTDPARHPFPAAWRSLPAAELIEFQARGEWNAFHPMEVIATLDERLALEHNWRHRPFIVFPESRQNPIRMTDAIPYGWAARAAGDLSRWTDTVLRNEYYVFQAGVYAFREPLRDLSVVFSDLCSPAGMKIPADRLTCFNLGGVDQYGKPFSKKLPVDRGRVQALWIGVDVPEAQPPGVYAGALTIAANGAPGWVIAVTLTVADTVLPDRGDGDHWRLSRLRWLNSSAAVDDEVCAPFTAIEQTQRTFRLLGRTIELDAAGMLRQGFSFIDMFSIQPAGRPILAAPLRFDILADGRSLFAERSGGELTTSYRSPGKVMLTAARRGAGCRLRTEVTIEMDGYLRYRVTLTAERELRLDGARLTAPILAEVARYEMDSGGTALINQVPAAGEPQTRREGKVSRPPFVGAARASVTAEMEAFLLTWIGDYNAGLGLRLTENRRSWDNAGAGRMSHALAGGRHDVLLDSGAFALREGEERCFEFELYLTPFKPLSGSHWQWRYYHPAYGNDLDVERGLRAGARIFNLHHGARTNPFISYPLLMKEFLRPIAARIHRAGGQFKLYYTIRELSTRAPELWALRSLGAEILAPPEGGLGYEELAQLPLEYQLREPADYPFTGEAWLCEHLVSAYHARWHTFIPGPEGMRDNWHAIRPGPSRERDSSLQISGASRWANFYLEGLRWLIENIGVDGIYLDGMTFDHEAFKRVRKTLLRHQPAGLIDNHGSCDNLRQLPFCDSIWFGEGADYSREPDYWLAAVSGVPFGTPGELLLDSTPAVDVAHRGMVYGLALRYGWWASAAVEPPALWAWWDEFGIQDSEMIGYWMAACPVQTGHPAVKATAYVRRGQRTAIAVASWSPELLTVKLALDWKRLGLDFRNVRVSAPALAGFQEALPDASLDRLIIPPNRGWLVVVSELF